MRLLNLAETGVIMHFYFTDGSYVRGYVARAELDPASRSGPLQIVVAESNRIITADAGDLIKVSSRGPNGVMH
jgi:hypothetical protein